MEWTPDQIRALATALELRRDRGARLRPETVSLVISALRLYAADGFAEWSEAYVIEAWDLKHGAVCEQIATASVYAAAEAAFAAACSVRPGLRVTMRLKIRNVRVREPREA